MQFYINYNRKIKRITGAFGTRELKTKEKKALMNIWWEYSSIFIVKKDNI